jgi:CubicO group peptidase (beta-lactamase class C family)
MRRFPVALGLAALLAFSVHTPEEAAAQTLAPAREAAPPPAELEAYIDGIVRDSLVQDHIIGATVAVVRDGQVILKKGYGAASLSPRRPVDPDRTLFRLGSVSKTFTWLTVLKETEAGRLRLDAPVNLFLPESVQLRDQGFTRPVTLRSLMSHSGGFEDRALGHLLERDPARVRPLAVYLRQERPRRVHPVGQMSSYSNYGAALAGEAAAWASGKTFERLAEESLFEPLAMGRTTFREPRPARPDLPAPMAPGLAADLSRGFTWTGSAFRQEPFEFIGQVAPSGSASSTADDMARYMIALLDGGRVGEGRLYGETTAAALRQPLRRTPAGINGWRHGFIAYTLPGGLSGFGHDGATRTFMTNMTLVPELGLGIFVSTNTSTGRALTQRLASRVVERVTAGPDAWPRPARPELHAQRKLYEGRYLGTRRAYSGLEGMLARLSDELRVEVTPEGRLVTREGGRIQSWVPEGPVTGGRFISDTGWERRVFVIEDGKARRMLTALNTQVYERTPFWSRPGLLAAAAAITGLAALLTLGAAVFRNRRDFRQTHIQARAGVLQGLQSVLWLSALGLFLGWAATTPESELVFEWPGLLLLAASASALVATLLSLASAGLLPFVLRSGRRLDSWTPLRRAGFAATAAVSLVFGLLLALWGGLSPWAG